MDQPAVVKNEMEGDVYLPSAEVVSAAYIQDYEKMYNRSMDDPEGFWGDLAGELDWYQKWDQVLDDSTPPFYKWFVGGKTSTER